MRNSNKLYVYYIYMYVYIRVCVYNSDDDTCQLEVQK